MFVCGGCVCVCHMWMVGYCLCERLRFWQTRCMPVFIFEFHIHATSISTSISRVLTHSNCLIFQKHWEDKCIKLYVVRRSTLSGICHKKVKSFNVKLWILLFVSGTTCYFFSTIELLLYMKSGNGSNLVHVHIFYVLKLYLIKDITWYHVSY